MNNLPKLHHSKAQPWLMGKYVPESSYFAASSTTPTWSACSCTNWLILKISEPACLSRENDQQGDEEEQPRRIGDMEKGVFRRDAGRAAVRGQNWRDRTSAFFAVSSS